jgi:hypothetical protein
MTRFITLIKARTTRICNSKMAASKMAAKALVQGRIQGWSRRKATNQRATINKTKMAAFKMAAKAILLLTREVGYFLIHLLLTQEVDSLTLMAQVAPGETKDPKGILALKETKAPKGTLALIETKILKENLAHKINLIRIDLNRDNLIEAIIINQGDLIHLLNMMNKVILNLLKT